MRHLWKKLNYFCIWFHFCSISVSQIPFVPTDNFCHSVPKETHNNTWVNVAPPFPHCLYDMLLRQGKYHCLCCMKKMLLSHWLEYGCLWRTQSRRKDFNSWRARAESSSVFFTLRHWPTPVLCNRETCHRTPCGWMGELLLSSESLVYMCVRTGNPCITPCNPSGTVLRVFPSLGTRLSYEAEVK